MLQQKKMWIKCRVLKTMNASYVTKQKGVVHVKANNLTGSWQCGGFNSVGSNSNYILRSQAQRCSLHQTLGDSGSLMTYIVSDGAAQLVHSWSCFGNFLGSADDIRCILQWPFPPGDTKSRDQWLFLIWSAASFNMQWLHLIHGAVCFGRVFFS